MRPSPGETHRPRVPAPAGRSPRERPWSGAPGGAPLADAGAAPLAGPCAAHHPDELPLLSIAIAGGKGGIGKTNLAANLAIGMSDLGRRVLLLDGDLSLANVDLLLGLAPRHTLHDVVTGRRRMEEIVLAGPAGVRILPAASGIEEMADLDEVRRERLLRSLARVTGDRDVLIIDTAPGIQAQNLRLARAADEILVVTTPEPPAFADAYATLKVLSAHALARPPRLVVTMARDRGEARRVSERIGRVARRFLGLDLELCGVIPRDAAVARAVRRQQPFVRAYPDSPAAEAIRDLARRLLDPPERPRRRARPAALQAA
ncbi:MAG: MinD/ParA family protein [Candidatus Eisenbacteria bacterium]|uniref:MinD/ParA family protein n=1 Tax=Eiseniibacteriota bacterium TaxID=2212470 RepID=A0A937XB69_UNCEI|nr:MinD/ParA family protein [Candidatus Eisenbacteria bacterium]